MCVCGGGGGGGKQYALQPGPEMWPDVSSFQITFKRSLLIQLHSNSVTEHITERIADAIIY